MSWPEGIRTRLRLLFTPGAAESRMEEEIRFHLEMEADRLEREEGLDPDEARRRALVTFGGVERTKEALREGRGLAWLSGLRLDVKLGARMLLKYPVLTGASVLALAIAVALAASWFQFMSNMSNPRIPLPDGDRIVTVRNTDVARSSGEPRSLHDFESWREELESIDHLAAGTPVEYTLTTEDGRFATLEGLRVTPSMFRVAGVQPLLGRALTDADLDPAAEPVVVIGHSAWQRVFDGDPRAVGRTVRLGSEYATVVGVMPAGFGFPVNEEIWTPLRERALDHARREGPPIMMIGRLAPGATLEEAQAELAVIGRRTSAEFPETHEHLRPEVRRFGVFGQEARLAALLNIPFLFFLLVVSANVATLLFARTATRESEIAMRSALGASRRRILLQLVAEALVLTSLAAVLGLAAAHWGLQRGMSLFWEVQQMRPPFWFRSGISLSSALYVCALAVIGALIIGGIPGLRATRRELRHRLPQAGAGGAGMRFGAIATTVIIVQVALCVAFIPVAIMNGRSLLAEQRSSEFPADSYLSARLTLPADALTPVGNGRGPARRAGDAPAAGEARAAELLEEVHRRLIAEPGILAATRASRLPGFNHPMQPVHVEGDTARLLEARAIAVDPDFFDVLGARITAGRGFRAEDATAENPVAVVQESWARFVFGAENPVGRRIRLVSGEGEETGPWIEIIGLVAGIDAAVGPGASVSVFRPLGREKHASVQLYARTDGPPEALIPQVHAVITAVEPDIAIADLKPLDDVWRPVQRSNVFFATALSVVGAIILLFALIGIYALMSFTVARRAREIGIRAALGANPRRIVVAIFSRAMVQIGIGVLAGAAVVSLTIASDPDGLRLVGGVAAAMIAVGLIGCVLPAVRALRIQPTEALRTE